MGRRLKRLKLELDMNNLTRIEQLLIMAMNSKSETRTLAIVEQILEINPDQTEALIIKADNTKQDSKRAKILEHALRSVEKNRDSDDDSQLVELLIYKRLGITLYSMGRYNEALEACEKILAAPEEIYSELEEDNGTKTIYYRLLIERREWQRILTESMKDDEHIPAWAYARLIAAFMISPDSDRKRRVCANMFWDALILSPEIPFYMLGYNPEPDDNEPPEIYRAFNFALIYYDILLISEEFRDFFTRGVVLFGLLSNRFDAKEREYMLDVIDALGGYEEYEKMSRILFSENDDAAIIEALAAHKCLSE